jgi:hypothetical protein
VRPEDHPLIESDVAKEILRLGTLLRSAPPGRRRVLFEELNALFPLYRPASDKEKMWVLLEMMNLRRFLASGGQFDICDD